MTVQELLQRKEIRLINEGKEINQKITAPYCCDLLSIAMGKAPKGAAWVTVMSNVNTLAVASLTEVACIILADGVLPDEQTITKAREQGITVLVSEKPVFETALSVYQIINA